MKYIYPLLIVFSVGCASMDRKPKLEPLPPQKLENLLFTEGYLAYKSVTKEDYDCPETC